MFRIFFVLAVLVGTSSLLAQTAANVPPPAPESATIYAVSDPSALRSFEEQPEITRRMADRLILAFTGQKDVAQGWKTLINPATDRVGIKLSTAGGRFLSSHRGVVESLIAGLEKAGVPRSRIILWDRNSEDLQAAGYLEQRNGVSIRAVNPPQGFDHQAKLTAPVLGKLIWGDVLFRGKAAIFQKTDLGDDGLSAESHLPKVMTREVTKIINVAVLSDEPGCGIAGAMYNVTVANLDNNRRFSQPQGAAAIPELYTDERIGPKVILNILDGLVAQYAAGPAFNANYAFTHNTLYASKDPVALDATAFRLMETWRAQSKLPPIGRRAIWLQYAEEMGIGFSSEERIEIKSVPQLP